MTNRYTIPDIATALGVKPSTVSAYRSRKQMPAPTGIVGRTPYWTDAAIGPWIERQKARRKHVQRAGSCEKGADVSRSGA